MNGSVSDINISCGLRSLIIFRRLLNEETLKALIELDERVKGGDDKARILDSYCNFSALLFSHGYDIGKYLLNIMLTDENIYTEYLLRGVGDGEMLEELLDRELTILSEIAACDGGRYRSIAGDITLPLWRSPKKERLDIPTLYRERMSNIRRTGIGIFAKYHMFILNTEGQLSPIEHPDPQSLEELVGYERERAKIILNTEAFLEGKPANNVLLYGDAGTGKSSTVKAIANGYADRGLRLVELKKDQLPHIQPLMDRLAKNPLKFILFIDDLTFSSNDADFCALKATLEGGVAGRGSNILIYATSNHRHMIKELASDRVGDEISVSDKLQEIVSLSARFGLTVTYSKADKALYSEIILGLAQRRGIGMDKDTLIQKAEAFALRGGGRNPRSAKQFIDMLEAGVI